MNAALRLLAERQDGLLLTSQVTAHGVDKRSLYAWVADDDLTRLARGLYVLTTHRATTPEDRHLQLARGGVLLMPDAVLSHWTALLAHGLPVLEIPRAVRLQRPIHRQLRRGGFVIDPLGESVGSASVGSESVGSASVDLTSVVSTSVGPAVPVAAGLLAQTRLRGLEAGLVSADAALREGAVTTAELKTAALEVKGPHAGVVRQMADLADGTIESVGESRLRYTCQMGGVVVSPQATIHTHEGEFVARVDFLVKGTNVILEFDGRVKYADGDGRTLWNEKQREDALRSLGYTIVRVTWADLAAPQRLLARIRQAVNSGTAAAG